MAYIKDDGYLPRNEYEMCELFGDLLFLKIDKFAPYLEQDPDRITFNDGDIALLGKTGILNRIFRKWMQTTWLNDGNSCHFDGATPRQELGALYPDLDKGRDFISAELERTKNGGWTVVPRYFSKKSLMATGGGALEMGLRNLRGGLIDNAIEPQMDCEFGAFIGLLEIMEKSGGKPPDAAEYGDEFTRYLSLFMSAAPANIILNCGMDLNEGEYMAIVPEISHYLQWLFYHQGKGDDDYFGADPVFRCLWGILKKTDKNLATYEEMAKMDDKRTDKLIQKSKTFKKSTEIFYRLGVAFDRYFLFPLDRYFGGVECVWTSKETFFDQMAITINSLKSNLKPRRDIKAEKKYLDIGDTIYDLRYNWFAPPTAFRFLESLYEK